VVACPFVQLFFLDDSGKIFIMQNNILEMGYHVIVVSDFDSLMKRLSVERSHAVVIRVDWTDRNAGSSIEAVRTAFPDVRVIVYAPYAGKSLREEFEKDNIRYFQHPFRSNEIRQAMV
jgi:DNA-binding NtrC family response regulator